MPQGVSRRVISLFLPNWATDRFRREKGAAAPPAEQPLVMAGRDGQRRVVAALDPAARALGLAPGMTIAHAQALVPNLPVVEAEPERDAQALERLAVWALKRYSPIVALDPPDGLWIDATGCAHLFDGEGPMLADLVRRLRRAGFSARAVVAGVPGAAHALARFAGTRPVAVVEPGQEAGCLAPLPIEALRVPPQTVAGLRRLGLDTIGALCALPRAPLVRRFGRDLARRLDQATGQAAEPLEPIAAPQMPSERRQFLEPIATAEHFRMVTGELAAGLCGKLAAQGLGARRLDLLFHRVDGRMAALRVGTAMPSRDAQHCVRLFAELFGNIDPGFGVEAMTLAAPLVEPLDPRQLVTSLADEPAPADLSGLVDTLLNRLGSERLYRLAPVESEVPERSMRPVPPLAPPAGSAWPAAWPRPARLFTPPEPVETLALLPDHPPVQFTWRGARHRIARADGPERIFGEWWLREAETQAVRDYFQVEDEAGARFWLFRAGDGLDPATGSHRWFLHGVFG